MTLTKPILALAAAATLALSGCSGDEAPLDGAEPTEVLAEAQKKLEEAGTLTVELSTDNLPQGVSGIAGASGEITSAPAFDGSLKVSLAGQSVDVPVIAVDGTVWAQLPFSSGWSDVDPAEYGAPDPAGLVVGENGFGSLLSQTEDLEQGETVRGGADNDERLTTYTGDVAGDLVKRIIPSAADTDDFDIEYQVDSEGQLRVLELTGVFYADSPEMTYTVDFTAYDDAVKEISKP